eukprot:gene14561-20602_t
MVPTAMSDVSHIISWQQQVHERAVMKLLPKKHCKFKRCSIEGEFLPKLSGASMYLAMENFHYISKRLGVGEQGLLVDIETQARTYCSADWEKTLELHAEEKEEYLMKSCFGAAYIYVVLNRGFGITKAESRLLYSNSVRSPEGLDSRVNWVLGALLVYVIPSMEKLAPPGESANPAPGADDEKQEGDSKFREAGGHIFVEQPASLLPRVGRGASKWGVELILVISMVGIFIAVLASVLLLNPSTGAKSQEQTPWLGPPKEKGLGMWLNPSALEEERRGMWWNPAALEEG